MNPMEVSKLIDTNVCGECGSGLGFGPYGPNGEYITRCPKDPTHNTLRPKYSHQDEGRIYMPLATVQDRQMQPRGLLHDGVHVGIALIQNEFPRAELTKVEAALFLLSCLRIGLDPMYGEAVPAPYRDTQRGTRKVQMIITEVGYLSLAARACPHSWQGPPNVEPVTDPEQKEAICNKRDAWVWKATGRTALMAPGQTTTSWGWYTQEEYNEAIEKKKPAADNPSNQARVRAIKRWVMENFGEAKAKMMEITGAYLDKVEGVPDVLELIEAEYNPNPDNPPKKEHWCKLHNTEFFKRGAMKNYAHKIERTDKWCDEGKQQKQAQPTEGGQQDGPPEMDVADFYDTAIKKLGFKTREQIHSALGVKAISEYKEPLETALDSLAQLSGKGWR